MFFLYVSVLCTFSFLISFAFSISVRPEMKNWKVWGNVNVRASALYRVSSRANRAVIFAALAKDETFIIEVHLAVTGQDRNEGCVSKLCSGKRVCFCVTQPFRMTKTILSELETLVLFHVHAFTHLCFLQALIPLFTSRRLISQFICLFVAEKYHKTTERI